MHLFTSEGIVLNKLRYLESDLIVTVLSKYEGKIKAIVKGGANSRKRFPGAFEAGNTGEFGFVDKNPYQLMHINHAKIDNYFINLKKDYEKILLLFYLLGLTDVMLPEHQGHPQLFNILLYTLNCLETSPSPHLSKGGTEGGAPDKEQEEAYHRNGMTGLAQNGFLRQVRLFYELKLLKETGLLHAADKCESCGRQFSGNGVVLAIRTGKFVCTSCMPPEAESYRLQTSLLELIRNVNGSTSGIGGFLSVDVPSVIFGFTTTIMKAYIDRPLKLWDMIDNL